MATTIAGNTYAEIQNGRVTRTFLGSTLPQYNASQITLVDVTGNVPNVGDVWQGGSSFAPYVPPAKTQGQINSEADRTMQDLFLDNIPLIMDTLEALATGQNKTDIKALNDKIKIERNKKA